MSQNVVDQWSTYGSHPCGSITHFNHRSVKHSFTATVTFEILRSWCRAAVKWRRKSPAVFSSEALWASCRFHVRWANSCSLWFGHFRRCNCDCHHWSSLDFYCKCVSTPNVRHQSCKICKICVNISVKFRHRFSNQLQITVLSTLNFSAARGLSIKPVAADQACWCSALQWHLSLQKIYWSQSADFIPHLLMHHLVVPAFPQRLQQPKMF